jgi:glycosyltransferase involved in cell wall biosynthesis
MDNEIKETMMEQWNNHFFNGEPISEGIMKEYEYKYKIAVVAIAKNEEQFVSRWAQSAKAPNTELWILDTGSDDSTVELAKHEGVNVLTKTFTPWRFDEARNHLLSLLPHDIDYVINLDLDEVLVAGWREAFETIHPDVTRPRYKYVWSWKDEEKGLEGLVYQGDKIVTRHGYRWKHPVHEVMVPIDGMEEVQAHIEGLEIHHHPDHTKSRSQYLPLLVQAVAEDPEDDRNTYYCARELYFNGQVEASVNLFKTHLSLERAQWRPERAWSMRYLAKMLPEEREHWLLRAVAEYPEGREPWVDLAKFYHQKEWWASCYWAASRALDIKTKPLLYLNEEEAWSYLPWDLAALSAYYMKMYEKAVHLNEEALLLNPDDPRLIKNHQFYLMKYHPKLTTKNEGV